VVLKTSTRQTIFLPIAGLVDAAALKPGDLVGVNKDSYLILDTLPAEYDSRVKAMEVGCICSPLPPAHQHPDNVYTVCSASAWTQRYGTLLNGKSSSNSHLNPPGCI
jgi:hypothetical protein